MNGFLREKSTQIKAIEWIIKIENLFSHMWRRLINFYIIIDNKSKYTHKNLKAKNWNFLLLILEITIVMFNIEAWICTEQWNQTRKTT